VKVRVRFTKIGRVRWTSHRDVARMWERALRRARVPVAYTAGFTPRPQLSFGLALPTGCESTAEYLDMTLDDPAEPVELSELAQGISAQLPVGVDVVAAGVIELGTPSLQEDVASCTWEIRVPTPVSGDLDAAVRRVLDAESLPLQRERKGRQVVDDLRPSVLALSCAPPDADGALLLAELGTRPRGVRPSELAHALGIELGLARRTCQWIEHDGSRWEPLRADPLGAAAVLERAS
jgi:radical SAM-linked protein